MFLHVTSVTYVSGYTLRLAFNNGSVRLVDLSGELYGTMFAPLKDVEMFRQVRLNTVETSIEWPNGADFAPEFLYERGVEEKQLLAA